MPSSIPRDAGVIDGEVGAGAGDGGSGGRGAGVLGFRISESCPGDSEVQLGSRTIGLSKQINLFTTI